MELKACKYYSTETHKFVWYKVCRVGIDPIFGKPNTKTPPGADWDNAIPPAETEEEAFALYEAYLEEQKRLRLEMETNG